MWLLTVVVVVNCLVVLLRYREILVFGTVDRLFVICRCVDMLFVVRLLVVLMV